MNLTTLLLTESYFSEVVAQLHDHGIQPTLETNQSFNLCTVMIEKILI